MRMKRGINREGLGNRLICSGSERAAARFSIIDDPMNLWFRPFRDKLSRMEIIHAMYKKVSLGFALFSAELAQPDVNGMLAAAPQRVLVTVV
jgi:hypothetical protein